MRISPKTAATNFSAFEDFENLLKSWSVDIGRLQESDTEVIFSVANKLSALRLELENSSVITPEQKSLLKLLAKSCSYISGEIQTTISLLDREEKLIQGKQFASIVDEDISTLLSLMEEIDSFLTTTTGSLNNESTSAYSTIIRLKKVMQSVTKSTKGGLTQKLIDTLEELENQLFRIVILVKNGMVQFTTDQKRDVTSTITAIFSADAAIDIFKKEVLQKETSHKKVLRLDELTRAVAVVKDYTAKLKKKIRNQSASSQTFAYTVDKSLISLLTSLQDSPENVKDAEFDLIYHFEDNAISLLRNDSIQVNDLYRLDEAGKRLETIVISKTEAASSRTSLVKKAEITYNAVFFVESINSIVDDLIYITKNANTSINLNIIANITSFLSSSAMTKYNEALVMKLEEYYDRLLELEEAAEGAVSYEGIDDLYDVSFQQSNTLFFKAVELESKAEKAAAVEEAETVTHLTLTVKKLQKSLTRK